MIGAFIDFRRLTEEEKKKPLSLVFSALIVVGFCLYVIGGTILEVPFSRDVGVATAVIGLTYVFAENRHLFSIVKRVIGVGVGLLFILLYIYFR